MLLYARCISSPYQQLLVLANREEYNPSFGRFNISTSPGSNTTVKLLVKEAQNKRKSTSMNEGNSSTHMDLDSDELAEVFGRDTRGRIRGVGSNISKKQFLQSVVTSSIVEEKNSSSYRDVKTEVAELRTTISRVEDMMTAMYRWQCASHRQEVLDHQNCDVDMTPRTEIGSRSINKALDRQSIDANTTPRTEIGSRSINKALDRQSTDANTTPRTEIGSRSINKQVATSSPVACKVKLCDKNGTEVARGHVVTDSTSGICHGRRVLPVERKVYVEEVLIGNALVYDGPQDGISTMEGFIGGGYVIWLEARLEKV